MGNHNFSRAAFAIYLSLVSLTDAAVDLVIFFGASTIQENSQMTLQCTVPSFTLGTTLLNWEVDSVSYAECILSCTSYPPFPGNYNFSFDTGNGKFYLDINPVQLNDSGRIFKCESGTSSDSLSFTVTEASGSSNEKCDDWPAYKIVGIIVIVIGGILFCFIPYACRKLCSQRICSASNEDDYSNERRGRKDVQPESKFNDTTVYEVPTEGTHRCRKEKLSMPILILFVFLVLLLIIGGILLVVAESLDDTCGKWSVLRIFGVLLSVLAVIGLFILIVLVCLKNPTKPPEKPKNFVVDKSSVTENTIGVAWERGFNGGQKQKFHLFCIETTVNKVVDEFEINDDGPHMKYTFKNLKPLTTYSLGLYAKNSVGKSKEALINQIKTHDPTKPPEKPKNFVVDESSVTENAIGVTWDRGFNGGQKQEFHLFCIETTVNKVVDEFRINDKGPHMQYTFENLKPLTTYSLKLYAQNSVGKSGEALIHQINTHDKSEFENTVF